MIIVFYSPFFLTQPDGKQPTIGILHLAQTTDVQNDNKIINYDLISF